MANFISMQFMENHLAQTSLVTVGGEELILMLSYTTSYNSCCQLDKAITLSVLANKPYTRVGVIVSNL